MSVFAVAGRSGAGKTTLLRRLIAELGKRGRTSAVVKHCGGGFDLGGADKDSSAFFRAGARWVTLSGPGGAALLRKPSSRPGDRDLAAAAGEEVDFVFIEGGKIGPEIPTIEVIGPNVKDRVPIRDRDRWIVVSSVPLRTSRTVLRPGDIGRLADLVEARGREDADDRSERLRKRFYARHDPEVAAVLKTSVVGVAGAGGLGSNVAFHLARAGVGKLIIADFDRVETSNLNRQQYFIDQVGRFKVEALAANLRRIPSATVVVFRRTTVTARNAACLFGEADVLIEAFDRAGSKQMLIEAWMKAFRNGGHRRLGTGRIRGQQPDQGAAVRTAYAHRRRGGGKPGGGFADGPAGRNRRGHAGQPGHRMSNEKKEKNMMKVNEYFGGKVKSIGFTTEGGPATIGVMAPGDYEFGTSTREIMTVVSGVLNVKLPGSEEWKAFKAGESFTVEKDRKFQLKVPGDAAYLCLYR